MFAADVAALSPGLAAKLQIFLEQHIGLRAYYPEIKDIYESIRSGHLEAPLPMDAIEGFLQGVRVYTPTHFEPNVSQSFEGVARPIPEIPAVDAETRMSNAELPSPPPDPLGEVDLEKTRRFEIGGAFNEMVKVFEAGDKVNKGIKG